MVLGQPDNRCSFRVVPNLLEIGERRISDEECVIQDETFRWVLGGLIKVSE